MARYKYTAAEVRASALADWWDLSLAQWAGRTWALRRDPSISVADYRVFLLIVAEAIDGVPVRVTAADPQRNEPERNSHE